MIPFKKFLKKYIFFPLAYVSALVNMVGLTIFRTISSIKHIGKLKGENLSTSDGRIIVSSVIAGIGTAIIVANIRKGELRNKILEEKILEEKEPATLVTHAPDRIVSMDNAPCSDIIGDCVGGALLNCGEYIESGDCATTGVDAIRLTMARLIEAALNLIFIYNTIFASISYQLGGRTVAEALVNLVDLMREHIFNNKPNDDESWQKDTINVLSFIFMFGSAAVFVTYNLLKSFKSSKEIREIIRKDTLSTIKKLNKTALFLTLLVAGFAAGFARSNNYFAAQPGLSQLPFVSLPTHWIEPLCAVAGWGATIQIAAGEMPFIYERFKGSIIPKRSTIPATRSESCSVSYKTLFYVTLTGILVDSISAALGAFRAPSFVAEKSGEDPNASSLILLGCLNALSHGLKTLMFSGLVGLAQRVADWKTIEKNAHKAASPSIQLSQISLLGRRTQAAQHADGYIPIPEGERAPAHMVAVR